MINDWLDHHPPREKEASTGEEAGDRQAAAKRRAVLRRMNPQATLDLHGLTVALALQRVDRFLEDAKARGLQKVLVIHGKGIHSHEGDGVLKSAVRAHIRNHPLAGETGVPDRTMGGEGALWVLVRYRSR